MNNDAFMEEPGGEVGTGACGRRIVYDIVDDLIATNVSLESVSLHEMKGRLARALRDRRCCHAGSKRSGLL